MHRRNRNIILFFEENENVRSITSKMVRLYMNRFTIDEEQRFEITGVFNLTKVPKVTLEPDYRHRRLWNLSWRNWIDDRELIKDAFKKLEFLTLFNTDVYIFMGTSLYMYLDTYNNNNKRYYNNNVTTLNELMRNLGQKCSSTTSISMTFLSGENHELHTKNDVQEMYRGRMYRGRRYKQEFFDLFGKSFLNNFYRSQSLNDELENLFSHMISTNYFYSQIITRKTRWLKPQLKQELINLFLYEMLSEHEIKTRPDLIRRSDDDQYLLSLCKVLTIYF